MIGPFGARSLLAAVIFVMLTPQTYAAKRTPAPPPKRCPGGLIGGCVHPFRVGNEIFYLNEADIQALRRTSEQNKYILQQQAPAQR